MFLFLWSCWGPDTGEADPWLTVLCLGSRLKTKTLPIRCFPDGLAGWIKIRQALFCIDCDVITNAAGWNWATNMTLAVFHRWLQLLTSKHTAGDLKFQIWTHHSELCWTFPTFKGHECRHLLYRFVPFLFFCLCLFSFLIYLFWVCN